MSNTHYVYMLRCSDDTLYTGYTTAVGRRVGEHNAGTGAKYTAGRTPVTLEYVEYHDTRSAAQSREHELKSRSRTQKEELLASTDQRTPIRFSSASQRSSP
jgi:putative endonuclease